MTRMHLYTSSVMNSLCKWNGERRVGSIQTPVWSPQLGKAWFDDLRIHHLKRQGIRILSSWRVCQAVNMHSPTQLDGQLQSYFSARKYKWQTIHWLPVESNLPSLGGGEWVQEVLNSWTANKFPSTWCGGGYWFRDYTLSSWCWNLATFHLLAISDFRINCKDLLSIY